jgi:hypothetical protein
VAETADNLRFHHAKSSQTKLRAYASFTYQAGSWTRPRIGGSEHIARIRVHLPTSCPEGTLFRTVALGLLRSGP